MKKKGLNVLSCVVSATLAFSLVACSGTGDSQESGGGNVTELNIGNVSAGMGDEWLVAVANKFEQAYANYQGADGKVGVKVKITNKLGEYATPSLITDMPYNGMDMYVVANSTYTALKNATHNGASILADITDVVTGLNYDAKGNLVADGTGTTSIASRMVEAYADYYNLGTETEASYYGLPFFATPCGAAYDADLFGREGLYFKADGSIGATKEDVAAGNCSTGPDGKIGSYDDGMPNTWQQFEELMNYMVSSNITPFIWSGANTYQRKYFFGQVYANYEGLRDYTTLHELHGEDSQFGEITPSDAWRLAGQEGRLASYYVVDTILNNPRYYHTNSMDGTMTHKLAQKTFIESVNTSNPIAIIFDGSWWENECREYFDAMSQFPGYGYGERDFRVLPIPNFEGTKLDGTTASTQSDDRQVLVMNHADGSAIYVSAQAKQLELAKEFVKFMHSREMLVLTTQIGVAIRPFEYEFEPAELAACTKFGQNIITMMNDENVDIFWGAPTKDGRVEKEALKFNNWMSENAFNKFYNTSLTPLVAFNQFKNEFNENNW